MPSRLVELSEQATQGVWRVSGGQTRFGSLPPHGQYHYVGTKGEQVAAVFYDPKDNLGLADAHFIAEAVNFVRDELVRIGGPGGPKDADSPLAYIIMDKLTGAQHLSFQPLCQLPLDERHWREWPLRVLGLTNENVERAARALCLHDGRDPEALEPGDIIKHPTDNLERWESAGGHHLDELAASGERPPDGFNQKGDACHFMWRRYIHKAQVAIRAAMPADGTGRDPSPSVVDGDKSRDEQ